MGNLTQIKELVQKLAGTHGVALVTTCDAEVVSVNEDEKTCIVNCIDANKTLDNLVARFMPTIDDGESNVPSVGSTVTVIFTSFTEPYVVKFSELTSKTISIGNQLYDIRNGKQKFNDGGYGGIPIVKDPDNSNAGLLKKINQLENKINSVNSRLSSFINTHKSPNWTVTPNDGGLALQTAITTWLLTPDGQAVTNISPVTSESDISNPNISHGKTL